MAPGLAVVLGIVLFFLFSFWAAVCGGQQRVSHWICESLGSRMALRLGKTHGVTLPPPPAVVVMDGAGSFQPKDSLGVPLPTLLQGQLRKMVGMGGLAGGTRIHNSHQEMP